MVGLPGRDKVSPYHPYDIFIIVTNVIIPLSISMHIRIKGIGEAIAQLTILDSGAGGHPSR